MKKTLLAIAFTTISQGAVIIPFSGIPHATLLPPRPVALPGATVTVTSNGTTNQGFIFEPTIPIPADLDLFVNAGAAIAISEGGRIDDERKGGTIRFDFSQPVTQISFNLIDVEEGAFWTWGQNPKNSQNYTTGNRQTTGNQTILFQYPQDYAILTLNGSGALASPLVTTVPEPSAALLALSGLFLTKRMRR